MPSSPDHSRLVARTPAPPQLLTELVRGEAVSGSVLAGRLGISRAAVWKQIERLRELGLDIGAQAGSGYRLAAPIELLDAVKIRAALPPAERPRWAGLTVHWQLDSTSSELQRRAVDDPRDRLACLAELQSAGRGRRGRAWRMPLGGGLALSLLKRFDDGMAALGGLSLVAGIAAVQAMADCGVAGVGLKWPNDLLARGRKLGGILVELGGDATGPCHAIVGIGLNLRLDARAQAAIDQPAIDLATLTDGAPPSRNYLAARLLACFGAAFERFAHSGFGAFAEDYAHLDLLRDRAVRVLRAGTAEDGIATGVDARGALRVMFADGERRVDGGEVSVRESPLGRT